MAPHHLDRVQEAARLMTGFAERTGLASDGPQQRYLWTDAFAVGNLLGLARVTGEPLYRELALRLIDRVHHTLGRHRADDPRCGWISGLGESEGEAHPTRGGLRIGKKLSERGPAEPFHEDLEWERDGQYFHYLTKWMQALDLAARETRVSRFNVWARELAQAACAAFARVVPGTGRSGLVWKMSIDLSHALVASSGHHDALDGFVAVAQLRATALGLACLSEGPTLESEMSRLAALIDGRHLATADPLGLGGLLMDAARLDQLAGSGPWSDSVLLRSVLASAEEGLRYLAQQDDLRRPATRRLAFRELGLAIGLHAVELLEAGGPPDLRRYVPLGAEIEGFWCDPAHRGGSSWSEHRDINEVMLATSLLPEGWLVLPSLD